MVDDLCEDAVVVVVAVAATIDLATWTRNSAFACDMKQSIRPPHLQKKVSLSKVSLSIFSDSSIDSKNCGVWRLISTPKMDHDDCFKEGGECECLGRLVGALVDACG